MTDSQLEELRYDVAHDLLSKMSKGSQYQYALDKMIELIQHATEDELYEMAPTEKPKHRKQKDIPKRGKGF